MNNRRPSLWEQFIIEIFDCNVRRFDVCASRDNKDWANINIYGLDDSCIILIIFYEIIFYLFSVWKTWILADHLCLFLIGAIKILRFPLGLSRTLPLISL